MRTCPYCASQIPVAATVCKRCGRDLPEYSAEQQAADRAAQRRRNRINALLGIGLVLFFATLIGMCAYNSQRMF